MPKDEKGEVLNSKGVVVVADAAQSVMVGGQAYVIANRVNVPTLKHEDGEVVSFRIDAPIREEVNYKEEEVVVNGTKVKAQKEIIINVVRVTELTSGQPHEYVCNAMTADNLRNAYPDHDYVGRMFAVQKLGLVPGKQYKATNVVEIAKAS